MKRVASTMLVIAVGLTAPHALAQNAGSADAEELFKQGRAALEAKDFPTACTKLAESNRLERAVGTLISLAQCEEAQNQIAAARQHWQEAADFADALQDRLQRGAVARQRFAELDKRVPRLTVRRAPNAPPTTFVKRGDVVLAPGSFGSALPVDPGKVVLVVSAEGREPRTFEVTLAEGETKELEVEPGAELPPPPLAPPPPLPDVPHTTPPDSTLRNMGYVVGGAGIVGLGLGGAFGLRASSKWSDAQSACRPNECGPGSQAQLDKESASTAGDIATVAFVIGGAALATGVVFLLLAPSRPAAGASLASARRAPSQSAPSVSLVPGLGVLSAVGRF